MTKINAELHEDVIKIINKMKNINDSDVDIYLPEGSAIFDNILNLKLIKQTVENMGMTVHFTTNDEAGLNLIESMEDVPSDIIDEDFVKEPVEVNKKIKMPRIKIALPRLRLPKFKLIVPIIVAILAILGFFMLSKSQKANVKIVVNAQPLTRSLTIRVKKDSENNPQNKIIKGYTLSTTIEDTLSTESTGSKEIGEKAEGTVTFYNKTTSEKVFKKGTVVVYDDDYKFTTQKELTVPARVDDLVDPEKITLGSAEVGVQAVNIGKNYNISKDKTLSIESYSSSDYVAKSKTDFTGGSSKTIKIVLLADRTKLSTELMTKNTESVKESLSKKSNKLQNLIKGTESVSLVSEEFDKEVNAESDKVSLKQSVSATGLAYSENDLNTILDKILQELVPPEYTISDKEHEVKVEVLGNSTSSVLNQTDADLQVTIKTYVVPSIDESKLKEDLTGKNLAQAQKILGSIKNVSTYELKINPRVPFFQKIPGNKDKIFIEIVRE